MNTVIFGDSHAAALKVGSDVFKCNEGWPQDQRITVTRLGSADTMIRPYFIDQGEYAEITHQEQALCIKRLPFAETEASYDYYGFCGPLNAGRLWRKVNNWLNFSPFAGQANLAPVSTGLLKQVILEEQRYNRQLIELLKRVGVKVFVIEAPKPYKHHPVLSEVNPDVIVYIDHFYKTVMKDWLVSQDIPIISIPRQCYDSDGFMLDKFKVEQDGIHANKKFGVIMIKEILKFLQAQN
jgi:hypothetical protein